MVEHHHRDPAFEHERRANIEGLRGDEDLRRRSIELLRDSGRHRYSYNFDWLGLPIIQYPQDIVAVQELLWRVRPSVVVETGVARGGSLALSATVLEILGGDGVVVGVEIGLRPENRAAILAHRLAHRIRLVDGSSTAPEVVAEVTGLIAGRGPVLVMLDSDHTHEHVRAELAAYAPLVTPDSYLVVFDTSIADMPAGYFPGREWGPGNNPATAVQEFLGANPQFEVDEDLDAKLLLTVARGGWLHRRPDGG